MMTEAQGRRMSDWAQTGDMLYAGRAMNYSHLAYRCKNNTKATVVFVDGHSEARSKDQLSYEANFAHPPTQ